LGYKKFWISVMVFYPCQWNKGSSPSKSIMISSFKFMGAPLLMNELTHVLQFIGRWYGLWITCGLRRRIAPGHLYGRL